MGGHYGLSTCYALGPTRNVHHSLEKEAPPLFSLFEEKNTQKHTDTVTQMCVHTHIHTHTTHLGSFLLTSLLAPKTDAEAVSEGRGQSRGSRQRAGGPKGQVEWNLFGEDGEMGGGPAPAGDLDRRVLGDWAASGLDSVGSRS